MISVIPINASNLLDWETNQFPLSEAKYESPIRDSIPIIPQLRWRDCSLVLLSFPTGLLEGISLLYLVDHLGGRLSPPITRLCLLATTFGYPVWTGIGIKKIRCEQHPHQKPPGSLPAFYINCGLQYAAFRTDHAPANLNYGFALEYWWPLPWGFGIRTGFHWGKRNLAVREKTYYDHWVMDEEMALVNLHYTGFEIYSPIELIFMHHIDSNFTIYSSIGCGLLAASAGGNVEYVDRHQPRGNIDYHHYDAAVPLPPENGIYIFSFGLLTRHTLWEFQYTVDPPSPLRPVKHIGIDDRVYTYRLRIGYRIPL